MNNNEEVVEIDLLRLVRALWRKVWVLIAVSVLCGVIALTGTLMFVTPTYRASVLMYVNSSDISLGGSKVSISQGELTAAQSLIDTYAVILKTRTTLNDVIQTAGVDYTYEELKDMISAESVNSTEVFQIDVVTTNANEAMVIANVIAQVLPQKIASIVEGSSARVVDLAVAPRDKDAPSYAKSAIIGALLGLLVSAGLVVVLELMDDKIHESDYLTQTYDLPVLAVIPDLLSDSDVHGYYMEDNKASK